MWPRLVGNECTRMQHALSLPPSFPPPPRHMRELQGAFNCLCAHNWMLASAKWNGNLGFFKRALEQTCLLALMGLTTQTQNALTRCKIPPPYRAIPFRDGVVEEVTSWKATKEYLNQRGTKIRVFRVCFRAPFLPPFFPHSPPFSPSGPFHSPTTSPLFTSPFIPPFLAPGKLRFRYPSDLGTL